MKWWEQVKFDSDCGAIGAVKYPLLHMVEEEFERHKPPIVHLKPYKVDREPDAIWNKSTTYMNNFQWYLWSSLKTGRRMNNTTIRLRIDCEHFIREHGEKLIKIYLNGRTIEEAILETETLTELWSGFYEWYQNKKRLFMEKELMNANGDLARLKKPNSHGGVANLLKVLTKTMQEQGADIRSIAKMQFAVCKQANIYLPEEFLTDVATTLDIEGEVNLEEMERRDNETDT